jgi:hypothetical protein
MFHRDALDFPVDIILPATATTLLAIVTTLLPVASQLISPLAHPPPVPVTTIITGLLTVVLLLQDGPAVLLRPAGPQAHRVLGSLASRPAPIQREVPSKKAKNQMSRPKENIR